MLMAIELSKARSASTLRPAYRPLLSALRALLRTVRGRALGRRHGHQLGVGLDVSPHDLLGARHRLRIAVAVDQVGLNEILLGRGRRIDAVVDCCYRTGRHACT